MLDLIYNIPPFCLRIIINTIVLLFLLGGTLLVKRYCARNNDDHDAVNGAAATVSMMYAIFLGFVIFASVNNLGTAEDSARAEQHLISTISYEASLLPKPINGQVQQTLKAYLDDVINKEWPAMKVGQINNAALMPLQRLKEILQNNRPADTEAINVNLWTDLVQKTNDLFQEHEDRMTFAQDLSLSKGVWYCLVAATVVMLMSNLFFFFTDRRKYVVMLFCIGIITGLLLFLETSINFPYRGFYGVGPEGFQAILGQMSIW